MLNTKNKNILWHLLAIAIVAVWGTTFVNTKVLFNSGLTPLEIFFLRFVIAYICIWFISPRQLFSRTWRDELVTDSRFINSLNGGCYRYLQW